MKDWKDGNFYIRFEGKMDKPKYRYMKVRYEDLEPTDLIQGIIRSFESFDLIEIEKYGNEIKFLGMDEKMVKFENGGWKIGETCL